MTSQPRHPAVPGPASWGYACVRCGRDPLDRRIHRPWWRFWERTTA